MRLRNRKLTFLLVVVLSLVLGLTVQAREPVNTPVLDAWEAFGAKETGLSIFAEEKPNTLNGVVVEGFAPTTYYGLKDSAGNVVIPAEYGSISYAGKNRLLLGSRVTDLQGNVILQKKNSGIGYIKDAGVFLVSESNASGDVTRHYLLDDELKQINGSEFYRLEHIADGCFDVIGRDGRHGIYMVGKGLVVPSKYNNVSVLKLKNREEPLFQTATYEGNYQGLYDANGRQLLANEYEWFEDNYGDFLVAAKARRPEYSTVGISRDNRKDWSKENNETLIGKGIVDLESGEVILPFIYDELTFLDNGDVKATVYTGAQRYDSGRVIGGQRIYYTSYTKQTTTISMAEILSNRPKFKDVPAGSWYFDAVQWAGDQGMLDVEGGYLNPLENTSRAEVVKYLWRAAGSPKSEIDNPFTDISEADSFYPAALWAYEQGITTGTGDGTTFTPNGTCTRAEVVTFLYRVKQKPAVGTRDRFVDVPQGVWFTDPVAWAVEQNITTGTSDTTFTPNGTCTRAEILTFVYRTYRK